MKNILLGVTGSIAAVKVPSLIRLLQKEGFDVRVVLTPSARQFVGSLALAAFLDIPPYTGKDVETSALLHISLARWADAFLIAPVSANTLAKLTFGIADNLLLEIALATKAPLILAPGMNSAMWSHPATVSNCETLAQRGAVFLGPASGAFASRTEGEGMGRFLEPPQIVEYFKASFSLDTAWKGRHVVITAGATREYIDPVRYITNESSGKMGYALAKAALRKGAQVTLISGPVSLDPPAGVCVIPVETAIEMNQAVFSCLKEKVADLFIATAAVGDFTPKYLQNQKIKRRGDFILELLSNPDIVASVAQEFPQTYVVAFAAETQDLKEKAREKLEKKKVDMVVANDVSRSDIGFHSEDNEVILFSRVPGGVQEEGLLKQPKITLAQEILARIENHWKGSHASSF